MDGVHGVEQGRMPAQPVLIGVGPGVHVGTRLDQGSGGLKVAELGGHMEQGHAGQGGEGGHQGRPVSEEGGPGAGGFGDRRSIVKQNRGQEQVGSAGAPDRGEGAGSPAGGRTGRIPRAAKRPAASHERGNTGPPRPPAPRTPSTSCPSNADRRSSAGSAIAITPGNDMPNDPSSATRPAGGAGLQQ